jgi:hypothetical protein
MVPFLLLILGAVLASSSAKALCPLRSFADSLDEALEKNLPENVDRDIDISKSKENENKQQ